MHPHLSGLARALHDEAAHQRRQLAMLQTRPIEERVAAGAAWAPLKLIGESWAARGKVDLALQSPRGAALHDGMGPGDKVRLGTWATPDDGPIGRCISKDDRVVEVRVPAAPDQTDQLAITRVFDDSTFARYAEALELAEEHRSPLRDVLLGEREPGLGRQHDLDHPALHRLNADQQHAARVALGAAELALVHGPPGTGKTTLIVALLQALTDQGEQPWALADSNAAVDNLCRRCRDHGLDVVRLGVPYRMDPAIRELGLDHRVENGSLGEALRVLERDIRALAEQERWGERRQLLAERDRLIAQARQAILEGADVIASTLGSLARLGPRLPRAGVAVVDEATQAIEPAVWSTVPHVRRLVLVGDPHQLGPVVTQPRNPLHTSLLERVLALDLPMPMLREQHRMHRAIQSLVDDDVYGGALRAHPAVAEHLLADLPGVADDPLCHTPLLWIDTAGAGLEEQRDPVTMSLYNPGEVRLASQVVGALVGHGVRPEDIGVITPYSAQVARLLPELPDGVEVASVNGFQGREKEAIVCTWVRANPMGELGFVFDRRRLTVAVTRARRLLVCIGDSATLSSSDGLARIMDRVHHVGTWASVWEPPWADALDPG